ncbi:hypothetical protein NKDENANG_01716 [Candidatus Entotheonellaceae bacterium PAL068K]
MKKVLIILASLIVVLLLAVIVVPKLINWNGYMAAMVKASTGRELRIDGNMRLSIWPNLEFFASDIHLSNAQGMTQPDMVSIGAVSGKLRLLPLLRRRVVIDSFVTRELSLNLEVAKDGRANWVFETQPAPSTESAEKPSNGRTELPIKDLLLGDVRFTQGTLSLINARTGQRLNAKAIDLTVALSNFGSPLTLDLRFNLNDEPVKVDLSVDSLRHMLTGLPATVQAAVASRFVTATYQGGMQQQPVPGLDGTFDLNIPSVGQLAAWLDRPLDASQPDPGPLKMRATFAGDGAIVALTEATIEGSALQARATGSFDGSGDMAKVVLNVESDRLDIDRYLPPTSPQSDPTAPTTHESPSAGDPLAALSDQPFDLGGLKRTTADIKIAIDGIQAMGYTIGRIAFSTHLHKGRLTADLHELRLYGGNLKGTLKLDGSGNELGLDGTLMIDGVRVDDLAQTATGGERPVSGTASGSLILQGRGVSPKALLENISGKVAFELGGVALKQAEVGSIAGLKLDLEVPGMQRQSRLKASVVYNQERVHLDLQLAPLKHLLAGEPFAAQASVASKLVNLSYDGTVQQGPVPGLDGTLTLDVASVARLLQWLDQPVDTQQPDPGPVKLRAAFEAKESQVVLKQASLQGKALQVTATGSVDNTGSVPILTATLHVENADLNAYVPASEPQKAPPATQTPQAKAAGAEAPSGWSEAPLDLTSLSQVGADLHIRIDSLRYRDLTVQPGRIKAVLKNGVLQAALEEFHVAGGTLASTVTLDASGQAASLDYQLDIAGLEARPLLRTLAGHDRLSGTTAFQAKGSATGRNQKELIHSLHGDGQFTFLNGAIHGINLAATLRKARSLGFDKQAGEAVKTDFAELSGSFVIKDGVVENRDLKMLAPLVRLSAGGLVSLPQRSVDYDMAAKLVATLKGQGGKDALAGMTIPIIVKGPWENISYTVDWQKVFGDIAANPERLQNLPQTLRDASQGFGVNLPIPKRPDGSKIPDTGQAVSPLHQLLQRQKKLSNEPTDPTTTQEPDEKKPHPLDPSKALKGLFQR